MVSGVHDTATPRIGLCWLSGIRLQSLAKNRYVGRTFIQPSRRCANGRKAEAERDETHCHGKKLVR
jgi:glutamine phosphoribosylpyrophosphate amidotransferase